MDNRTWWTNTYNALYRATSIGPADIRPCGCQQDPVVFGHFWSGCTQLREAS